MYYAEYWDYEEGEYVSIVTEDFEHLRDWCLQNGVDAYETVDHITHYF